MDNDERKIFWDTLCSLKGENIEQEAKDLLKTIKNPPSLFRYRSVNTKSLEALRTNTMYFSSSNYYDDPFDTFLNINIDGIKSQMTKELDSPIYVENFLQNFNQNKFTPLRKNLGFDERKDVTPEELKSLFSKDTLNFINENMRNFRNIIKQDTWSVCFSENGKNETLWLKYANQHKGFALEYDLQNTDSFIFGGQKGCVQCAISRIQPSLYPIYYSNEKYDATKFATYILKSMIENYYHFPGMFDKVLPVSKNQTWERERVSLIKKECHHYDEEWRFLWVAPPQSNIYVRWSPCKIILGLNMALAEQNLTITMARQAGIPQIEKAYIRNDGVLDYKPIQQVKNETM